MHIQLVFNLLSVQEEKSELEVCKGKDEVIAAKEQEIAAKERTLSDERQRVSSLADECATLGSELEQLTVSHINELVNKTSSDYCTCMAGDAFAQSSIYCHSKVFLL